MRNNVRIMIHALPVLSIVILAMLSQGCKKLSGCITTSGYNEYLVELPVKLYPAKDSFSIGDTIWMEQSFKDELYDRRNKKNMSFKDFNFDNVLIIADLINYPNTSAIHDHYTYEGATQVNSLYNYMITYSYQNGTYSYKVGIILKKSGLFQVTFSSHASGTVDFTKCRTENLDLQFPLNEKGDNNYHMMAYAHDPFALEVTKDNFDKYGGYCFYVK